MTTPQPPHRDGVKTIDELLNQVHGFELIRDGLWRSIPPKDRLNPLEAKPILEAIMQDYAMKYAEKVVGEDKQFDGERSASVLKMQQHTTNLTLKGKIDE